MSDDTVELLSVVVAAAVIVMVLIIERHRKKKGTTKTAQDSHLVGTQETEEETREQIVGKWLEKSAIVVFALVLIMNAASGFMPDIFVGVCGVGLGLIILGLTAIRDLKGMGMSWISVVMGFVALICGIGYLIGLALPTYVVIGVTAGACAMVTTRDRSK